MNEDDEIKEQDAPTTPQTLEDFEQAAEEFENRDKKERKQRDDAEKLELFKKFGVDFETQYCVVHCPDAPVNLPGFVVCKRLPNTNYSRYMMTLARSDKAAQEAKAKFWIEQIPQLLVYPTRERYAALCESYPWVADSVSGDLIAKAKAGAQKSGKG